MKSEDEEEIKNNEEGFKEGGRTRRWRRTMRIKKGREGDEEEWRRRKRRFRTKERRTMN